MMSYAKLKIAVPVTVAALVLGGTPIALQQKKIGSLETGTETLRAEVLQLENQEPQFVTDPNLVAEMERLRANALELLRLRGEVAMLRREKQELNDREVARATENDVEDPDMESAVRSWMVRLSDLQSQLQQTPAAAIPEFHLLTQEDWLEAAKGELSTEEDYRKAFSALRNKAQAKFASIAQPALREFLIANDRNFPVELAQLKSYFEEFVDDSVLERYEIIPADRLDNLGMGGEWIISQKAPVDEKYDVRVGIGPNGFGTTDYGSSRRTDAMQVLAPIINEYSLTHDGRLPLDISELSPLIETPEQQNALETVLQE